LFVEFYFLKVGLTTGNERWGGGRGADGGEGGVLTELVICSSMKTWKL